MHLRVVLACAVLLFCPCASAVPPASPPAPLLGCAWYPEQWPEARWEADLTLMQQAHMDVVRVGEFAWSSLEPAEGQLRFEWLDHAIALAAKHGIYVVLGTPSAAPPAWLTAKYPETLRVEENGQRAEHGNRQQFSANDPHYRQLAARIAGEMARRYGHNANVLGWQIDNEIGAPTFDDSARKQWHSWLRQKYGSAAALNQRWATAYWSQTYDTFDEIPLHSKGENPALLLDYKHFVTDTWTSYVQDQINAIRPNAAATQFITTNTMHWFQAFDHYQLHRNLDLAAWDDYFPIGKLDAQDNAAAHDLVRGYKQKNFWVMETQPAFVNWNTVNAALPPGVTREAAWQAVGHGADAVLYWQWRSAPNGQEEYHGTLVGADGLPVPVYDEIQQLGDEFAKLNAALSKTGQPLTAFSPHGRVALLQSYDSHWAIDFQRHTAKFDYVQQFMTFYRAIAPEAQSVDVLSPEASLAGYAVVFAPALNVLSDAAARHLLEYVRGGGHLVLGPRSAMKNADDGLQPNGQPGPFASALGAHVQQFYALDTPVLLAGDSGSGQASIWAEDLRATDPGTRILLRYGKGQDGGDSWLTGHPAAVSHAFGKGTLTYFGSDLDARLMADEVRALLTSAKVRPLVPGLPEGVEVMERSAPNGGRLRIFLNHTSAAQAIDPQEQGTDLLTGKPGTAARLTPHGVAVFLLARQP